MTKLQLKDAVRDVAKNIESLTNKELKAEWWGEYVLNDADFIEHLTIYAGIANSLMDIFHRRREDTY
jgi:hypothetical protein